MSKRKVKEEEPAVSPSNKRKRVQASDFEPVDPVNLPANSKLDLADCEIYYIADFVDKKTARRWYNELLELETCECARTQLIRDMADCTQLRVPGSQSDTTDNTIAYNYIHSPH